ncbi:hypothetical protein HPB48_023570 [Haemaphysalis longicornis]|uniref:DDE Tnp4 domain-containing protein n=1 Tax=Haemaphysalis longicornis TaxID=44386 RepID=A0A9J6GWT1_HAELO|nr:hypothetical protein HPB48_023570 [Haemaphysalis longicornis]
MELVDSDSEDEEFDDLVAALAVKLVRKDRNRIPLYYRYPASPFFPEFHGGRPRVSAQKTCLVVLTYLGNQCNMYSIADRFDISESPVHACIERVLNLLHSLSAEVISWPDEREQERIKAGFLLKSAGKGPRNTIGCVDGSHVEINTPRNLRSRTSTEEVSVTDSAGDLRQRKQIQIRTCLSDSRVRPMMLGCSVRDPFLRKHTKVQQRLHTRGPCLSAASVPPIKTLLKASPPGRSTSATPSKELPLRLHLYF